MPRGLDAVSQGWQRQPPDIILCNYNPNNSLDVPHIPSRNDYRSQRRHISPGQSKVNRMLDTCLKLSILKILIIDIGISVGDTATDFLQGVNLLQNEDTFYYGLVVIASKWIPVLVSIIHLWFSQDSSLLVDMGYIKGTLFIILVILIFPILPSLLYLNLLFIRRQRDQKKLKRKERRAHEIRSITGSVESPIQVIIVLYLMLRGKIPLPWDEPLDSSCLEDALGRVACLPSIPIATLIFSLMAIVKAMFNLNVYPILADQENILDSTVQSIEIFLRFTPFLVANAIFRVSAFSFMLVYFDMWTSIPIAILFLFNIIVYSISFTKFHKPSTLSRGDFQMNSIKIKRPDTLNLENLPSQSKCQIGWDPNLISVAEDDQDDKYPTILKIKQKRCTPILKEPSLTSRTVPKIYISPAEEGDSKSNAESSEDDLSQIGWKTATIDTNEEKSPLTPTTPTSVVNLRNKTSLSMNRHVASFVGSIYSTTTVTPRYIDEQNTCIFLNSFSAMFFPSCHTHLHPQLNDNISTTIVSQNKISELIIWQKSVFKRQAFLFNLVILLILFVIFILIRFTPFRYHNNILDEFWFNMVFGSLTLMGLTATLLAVESDCFRMVNELLTCCFPQKHNKVDRKRNKAIRSVSNVRNSYFNDSEEISDPRLTKCRSPCKKTCICMSTILFIFVPIIIAFILYKTLDNVEPYFMVIQHIPGSSSINTIILGASLISIPKIQMSNVISGSVIITDCSSNKHISNTTNFEDKILVIENDLTCKDFDKNLELLERRNAKAIILVDNTPKRKWRVSSNLNYIGASANSIPTLMIRNEDWEKIQLSQKDQLHLLFRKPSPDDIKTLVHCTNSSIVDINQAFENKPRKYLSTNGHFFEHFHIDMTCWRQGQQCSQTYLNSQFETNTKCESDNIVSTSLQFVDTKVSPKQSLQPNSLPFNLEDQQQQWKRDCCYRKGNNSMFLSTIGKCSYSTWGEVKIARETCKVTPNFMGPIQRDQRENEKFCITNEQKGCVIRETYISDPKGQPLSITCFSHC